MNHFTICITEDGIPYNLHGPFSSMETAKGHLIAMEHCDLSILREIEMYAFRHLQGGDMAYVVTSELP